MLIFQQMWFSTFFQTSLVTVNADGWTTHSFLICMSDSSPFAGYSTEIIYDACIVFFPSNCVTQSHTQQEGTMLLYIVHVHLVSLNLTSPFSSVRESVAILLKKKKVLIYISHEDHLKMKKRFLCLFPPSSSLFLPIILFQAVALHYIDGKNSSKWYE